MRSTSDARTHQRTPAALAPGPTRRPCALSLDASPRMVAQRRQIQAAFGPVVQRAITLGTLTAKLQEVKVAHGSYQGTLDDDTSPDVANAVGGQWVGAGRWPPTTAPRPGTPRSRLTVSANTARR